MFKDQSGAPVQHAKNNTDDHPAEGKDNAIAVDESLHRTDKDDVVYEPTADGQARL